MKELEGTKLEIVKRAFKAFKLSLAHSPNIKIVIGGTGIKNFVAEINDNFYMELKNLKLIDDYIYGDGENSLYEYVIGNLNYRGWYNLPHKIPSTHQSFSEQQNFTGH